MMKSTTPDQKAQLEKDGFLVLPQFVPSELIGKAKRLANTLAVHPKADELIAGGNYEDAVTDLWNKSMLPAKMKELLGGFLHEGKKMLNAQVALILPGHRCTKVPGTELSTYNPEKVRNVSGSICS